MDVTAGSLWRILRNDPSLERFTALDGVDLDVPSGQFVGLLGRNGAGKSTLLRVIGGVHAPDSGRVLVDGEMAALYELGIGGNEHLHGRDFARRWFGIVGTGERPMEELLAEAHEFSELSDAIDRPIRTYSSGMKARLFFAVATALPAAVYVIDELLSVGDEYFQHKCWRRLRERLAGGASGLLATHDWTAILKLCRTSCIIQKGKIVDRGDSPTMVRHYLGIGTDDLQPGAKFAPTLPRVFEARSLSPFFAEIDIDVTEPGQALFGLSVERFLTGHGWEHVLHADLRPVSSGTGRQRVAVEFDQLRLPAGEYIFGLFLKLRAPDGNERATDVRAWTHGNPLTLVVRGEERDGAVRLPLSLAGMKAA
jgi:lipopolysaccharide transport system ATP-binding protein